MTARARSESTRYGVAARSLHWLTVVLLAIQIPVGVIMAYRGNVLNLWNAVTDFLYSMHKSLGFMVLLLVVIRLLTRTIAGAPAAEPSLDRWQRVIAGANHAGLYLLLLVVAVLGWLGASLFPALEVFGVVSLPSISEADRAASDIVFSLHRWAAFLLLTLVALHVGAALHHHFVRRDGVLRRMLP